MAECDALFVSPHLDDVVLSCPGHVLDERAAGARVLIATLFTDGADRDAYALRRDEDRRAAALLGVDCLHLGLLDAPSRRGHPAGFRALILETGPGEGPFDPPRRKPPGGARRLPREFEPRPGDGRDRRAVAAVLDELVTATGATRLYAPLGVGEHIDHRLAFAAARDRGGALRCYEDRPYASVAGAVEARLRTIGASPAPTVDVATYRAALERAPFVRAWLPDPVERAACLDELERRFAREAPDRIALAPAELALDAAAVARARAAMAAYHSQLADLFGPDGVPPADALDRERIWTR
jgi:LmbE family N-acetylglucosaminyl deacetylase